MNLMRALLVRLVRWTTVSRASQNFAVDQSERAAYLLCRVALLLFGLYRAPTDPAAQVESSEACHGVRLYSEEFGCLSLLR